MSRVGNFSSSSIHNLMSKGRGNWSLNNTGIPFKTYVQEKIYEINLGRSISSENNARSTSWGTLVEEACFDKLGMKYSLVSQERFYHKDYKDYWSGMPDIITECLVGDIKCPWTMKSFCDLVKSMSDLESFKKSNPSYYWQLVSNAILCEKDIAIIIVYCPYLEDLESIRELSRTKAEQMDNRFAFINWSEDGELPYLIKDKKYTDINTFEFQIPQKDKDLLTQRVELAISELKNGI